MEPTSRRNKLNAKQIHTLKLIYKFRFITAPLLAEYKGVLKWTANNALAILTETKYLSRKYDTDNDRIDRKAATYYLAHDALTYLRDTHALNATVLHAMYNNKTVGEPFINRYLDTLRIYLRLRDTYPGAFHLFTKSELGDFEYFPDPRPDLYLNRIEQSENQPNEYVLEVCTNTQPFVIYKRFAVYLQHYESGEWEAEAQTPYPTILFVCPSVTTERKVQKEVARILDNTGIVDLKVLTTTAKTLLDQKSSKTIWSDVTEPEVLLSL